VSYIQISRKGAVSKAILVPVGRVGGGIVRKPGHKGKEVNVSSGERGISYSKKGGITQARTSGRDAGESRWRLCEVEGKKGKLSLPMKKG